MPRNEQNYNFYFNVSFINLILCQISNFWVLAGCYFDTRNYQMLIISMDLFWKNTIKSPR